MILPIADLEGTLRVIFPACNTVLLTCILVVLLRQTPRD
jgi:hypothetical protein